MKREIKFKFWLPTIKRMTKSNNLFSICENVGIKADDYITIPLQYTGLKDKNGTEIYEGDIIRIEHGIGVIVWDWVQWAIASGDIGNYHAYDYFIGDIMKDIEVVGNIYENPNYKGIVFDN